MRGTLLGRLVAVHSDRHEFDDWLLDLGAGGADVAESEAERDCGC